MSEKIVRLNEEVIKGQLKELARGGIEGTIRELNKKVCVHIEDWRNRPLQGSGIRMSMWMGFICASTP